MTQPGTQESFHRALYFHVIIGVLVGFLWPHTPEQLMRQSDTFIKLVRMMISPLIFLSLVVGIASVGDFRSLGRIGLKALLYFEVVTTLSLVIGLVVATVIRPFILFVLMLNSKIAAAVTGRGFITLADTLAAIGTIPVAGITLMLGVDRFMSEMRSLTNLVDNGVAPIVISRWEGQFDEELVSTLLLATVVEGR